MAKGYRFFTIYMRQKTEVSSIKVCDIKLIKGYCQENLKKITFYIDTELDNAKTYILPASSFIGLYYKKYKLIQEKSQSIVITYSSSIKKKCLVLNKYKDKAYHNVSHIKLNILDKKNFESYRCIFLIANQIIQLNRDDREAVLEMVNNSPEYSRYSETKRIKVANTYINEWKANLSEGLNIYANDFLKNMTKQDTAFIAFKGYDKTTGIKVYLGCDAMDVYDVAFVKKP